jgi:hypothetical protein
LWAPLIGLWFNALICCVLPSKCYCRVLFCTIVCWFDEVWSLQRQHAKRNLQMESSNTTPSCILVLMSHPSSLQVKRKVISLLQDLFVAQHLHHT